MDAFVEKMDLMKGTVVRSLDFRLLPPLQSPPTLTPRTSNAHQDEDGDAVEAVCLDEAFDPLIAKFKDWLFHRALKPDEPLPPLREDIAACVMPTVLSAAIFLPATLTLPFHVARSSINPPPKLLKDAAKEIDALKAAFPLEIVSLTVPALDTLLRQPQSKPSVSPRFLSQR